jgi:hypothetical protein
MEVHPVQHDLKADVGFLFANGQANLSLGWNAGASLREYLF